MKLYQTYLSPFPTRVRVLLYAKNIDVEIVEPDGFHGSQKSKGSYEEVNPIGRIPALVLDDGRVLPESEVICEYLEDAFPEPSLRPTDPWALAQVRLLSRISDFYVVMAMVPLFNESGKRRADWNRDRIDAAVVEVFKSLEYLEEYIGEDGYAVGTSLTQADGVLLPILMLASKWAPALFGTDNPFDRLPKLAAYYTAVQLDPIAKRVMDETLEAIGASQGRRK